MSEPATQSGVVDRMPDELKVAQEAIHSDEVQEMLRKLSEYNLGIYMPHKHSEESGSFEPLAAGETQLEDDLEVSFHRDDELVDEPGKKTYVPVGWFWQDGITPQMKCTARCVMMGTMHTSGHDSQPD